MSSNASALASFPVRQILPKPCRDSKRPDSTAYQCPRAPQPPIVAVLDQVVGEALKDPEWAARLTEIGGIAKPMAPRAEFGRLVADETEKWRKVVEFAGVPAERQWLPTWHCRIAGQPVRGVGTVACRASGKAGGACSSMVRAGRS
jgi:hypothetical protein